MRGLAGARTVAHWLGLALALPTGLAAGSVLAMAPAGASSAASPASSQSSLPPAASSPPPAMTEPEDSSPDGEAATDLWAELRSSFVMDDCGTDSSDSDHQAVAHWAHLFTETPRRFEANLNQALPSLTYIQQIAKQQHIPGEFVLLPWIESHYLPVFGRRSRPAGLWQITPGTAKTIGLKVNPGYDGRLDTAATTEAIFDMIDQYHQQYHDWRLADYAFNGGPGTMGRALDQHGAPPASPAIPKMPVKRVTREHLVKLMAIACVIRQPEVYSVHLPRLKPSARLQRVAIPHAMPVAEAAAHAGMPAASLTQINSAFLDGHIDPHHSDTLLLPSSHVQQWYASLANGAPTSPPLLSATSDQAEPPLLRNDGADDAPAPSKHQARHSKRYAVRPGDTLGSIARHHHLSLQQLQHWNHLGKQPLKPGQVLRLGPAGDN